MKSIVRTLAWGLALLIVAGGFVGCNTVRGMGKDIQAGGKAVERAAQ
ncbi:MAG: entericidin A/B family lipoprotein [Candidatus Hydrogenedentes bacterium]|nr:entericidin A/B family lipoprotein [Candidatus Hydrogenedentota bacterium]